jgi:hypothetical protein
MIVIHYVFRVVTSTFTFENTDRARRSSAELNTHCWYGRFDSFFELLKNLEKSPSTFWWAPGLGGTPDLRREETRRVE